MSSSIPIQLSAAAPTDYWRKPPNLDVSSAPTSLKSVPVSQFRRARVTITAPWTRLYDQGGLLILFPYRPDHETAHNGDTDGLKQNQKQYWLKTGIEFYGGRANVSTVSAREWADWSLLPLPGNAQSVTVEIERERPAAAGASAGPSLWVYHVDGEKRIPVREVTWAFEREEGELQVGVYVARPTVEDEETGEKLFVTFSDLLIEYSENT